MSTNFNIEIKDLPAVKKVEKETNNEPIYIGKRDFLGKTPCPGS